MYWKTKETPSIFDTRVVKKFAFLPTRCDNGYVIWLDYYLSYQMYGATRWFEQEKIFSEKK